MNTEEHRETGRGTGFRYRARDEAGKAVSGEVIARDREEAGAILSDRGLFVTRITPRRAEQVTTSQRTPSRSEIAWQMQQLAMMVETKVPLSDSLHCLARQANKPHLRAMFERLAADVCAGQPLSAAMRRQPKTFPASVTSMVEASEMSGTMDSVLRRCADYLIRDLQVLRRIRAAFVYPAFMLAVCMVITGFLLSFVLPRFSAIFAARGQALPAPTRMLMSLSDTMTSSWQMIVLVAAGVLAVLLVWVRSSPGRKIVDHVTLALPVVGPVFNALHQCRAFRTMAMLLEADVPLVDTLGVLRNVVPNRRYQELWKDIQEQIQVGERFATPMFESGFVSEPIAQMVENADRSGSLGPTFERLATFMEDRYERTITTATQFIEPALIIVMGGIVGFVALAMLLPLFRAAQVVAG